MALTGTSIDMIWVVGGGERVRNVARNHHAVWQEEMGRNLNDTLSKAIDQVSMRGKAALYLAGDLPFIKPADVYRCCKLLGATATSPSPRPAATAARTES